MNRLLKLSSTLSLVVILGAGSCPGRQVRDSTPSSGVSRTPHEKVQTPNVERPSYRSLPEQDLPRVPVMPLPAQRQIPPQVSGHTAPLPVPPPPPPVVDHFQLLMNAIAIRDLAGVRAELPLVSTLDTYVVSLAAAAPSRLTYPYKGFTPLGLAVATVVDSVSVSSQFAMAKQVLKDLVAAGASPVAMDQWSMTPYDHVKSKLQPNFLANSGMKIHLDKDVLSVMALFLSEEINLGEDYTDFLNSDLFLENIPSDAVLFTKFLPHIETSLTPVSAVKLLNSLMSHNSLGMFRDVLDPQKSDIGHTGPVMSKFICNHVLLTPWIYMRAVDSTKPFFTDAQSFSFVKDILKTTNLDLSDMNHLTVRDGSGNTENCAYALWKSYKTILQQSVPRGIAVSLTLSDVTTDMAQWMQHGVDINAQSLQPGGETLAMDLAYFFLKPYEYEDRRVVKDSAALQTWLTSPAGGNVSMTLKNSLGATLAYFTQKYADYGNLPATAALPLDDSRYVYIIVTPAGNKTRIVQQQNRIYTTFVSNWKKLPLQTAGVAQLTKSCGGNVCLLGRKGAIEIIAADGTQQMFSNRHGQIAAVVAHLQAMETAGTIVAGETARIAHNLAERVIN